MQRLRVVSRHQPEEDPFDRQRLIPGWDQGRLRAAKVMVVGAGAIGNEVLKNLALLGVGYLFVVDFDLIARSNLSRTVLFRREDVGRPKAEVAARRVRKLCLAPKAKVDWFHGDLVWDLGTGVFRRMDVVLGCVDNLEARLALNRQCRLAGTPWIDAGMHELACHVSVFPADTETCFECGVSATQMRTSHQRYSCDDFKRREVAAGRASTSVVTGALVAALQVQEAVKLLCGQKIEPGEHLFFQGTVNDFDRFRLGSRPGCLAHDTLPQAVPLELSVDVRLRDFLARVSAEDASGPGALLDLSGERGFVLRARCRGCSQRWVRLMAPSFRLFDDDIYCRRCKKNRPARDDKAAEQPTDKEVLGTYDLRETPPEVQDLTLHQIGVPRLAMLPVRNATGDYRYYELAGDGSQLMPGLQS